MACPTWCFDLVHARDAGCCTVTLRPLSQIGPVDSLEEHAGPAMALSSMPLLRSCLVAKARSFSRVPFSTLPTACRIGATATVAGGPSVSLPTP